MPEKSRLQKILASSGVASRRKAEELIAAGRVTVNGRVARLGDSAVPGKDTIALDGTCFSRWRPSGAWIRPWSTTEPPGAASCRARRSA